jgi:hypothetical protein
MAKNRKKKLKAGLKVSPAFSQKMLRQDELTRLMYTLRSNETLYYEFTHRKETLMGMLIVSNAENI